MALISIYVCMYLSIILYNLDKSKCISNDNDGWGFDDGGWQPMDTPLNEQKEDMNCQELNQKRREERRLKQQAAREKRSSGMVLKPSGLGAIKKD